MHLEKELADTVKRRLRSPPYDLDAGRKAGDRGPDPSLIASIAEGTVVRGLYGALWTTADTQNTRVPCERHSMRPALGCRSCLCPGYCRGLGTVSSHRRGR
ncbi:hypothetical protein DPEC_G00349820 [Dallia pectoralis]|uniref:Uncharacterized protein n=1 Tax=Dallia pectoralis TaxID=75939 RepID=A0ACC2F1J7_DALPE|nr:hypothetical protein DPEC_G00349820 [Dallia pectoralis]